MKEIVTTERKPIKLWLKDIEPGAMEQAKNLANLPFIHKHIAIMPDAHQGYGMPIGGIMATHGVVIPNAVGVDIGCGMCAVKTSLTSISQEKLKSALQLIRKTVPLGFKHHKHEQDSTLMPEPGANISTKELPIVSREYKNALTQLGTLGGGNHFIEIQKGSDGFIWLMIHSGSRNLGYKVANHYNSLAIELNTKAGSEIPKKWQLAFLLLDSFAGNTYLQEMDFCVQFAFANRRLMMDRVQRALQSMDSRIVFEPIINIAHNYAAKESHYGKHVIIHRKGATSAREGEIGIIPGSQGAPSYIVRGKGNSESFKSCSHGAGRKMGRKQAQRQLSLSEEKNKLDKQNIIHSIRGKRDLDEAAGAYKDIDAVIDNQLDLIEVITELQPLAVIKG